MSRKKIVVIGGGVAGFLVLSELPSKSCCRSFVIGKNRTVLNKVRISGGGRCNVTHACFDDKNCQSSIQEEEVF
jgi:predicted flavoprotein YhiN